MRHNYERLRDSSWVTVCANGTLEEVGEQLYSVVMAEVHYIRIARFSKIFFPLEKIFGGQDRTPSNDT